MLQIQFLLVNAHFTINLLAGLVAFAVSWLYFDAWLGRKDMKEGTKTLGFFLLAISFAIHSVVIEQTLLANPLIPQQTLEMLASLTRIASYIVLIVGQIIDPIQPLPEYRRSKTGAFIVPVLGLSITQLVPFTLPVFATAVGFMYLRRSTTGLEHHLKPISWSFFVLAIYETFGIATLFRDTSNVTIAELVKPFGSIWVMEHIVLFIGMFILGRWVWGYLIKRLETQLFMIFTSTTLVIFLITAIFFTSVSLANLRNDILKNLEINVAVLEFTLDSKKAQTLSDAELIAQNSSIIEAVEDGNTKALRDIATETVLAKNQDILVIVSDTGAVLMRGEDPEKAGGSLSDDPLVSKALNGNSISGVVVREGVMAPSVSVRASVPIYSSNDIIGAVILGSVIDNAFVDGLKEATSLDASIYGDNIRSATTFIAPDGKSRWTGIKEETDFVKRTVLADGELYSGDVNILNVAYLSAFAPIKDVNDNPIGMLFVGRPEVSTIQAAGNLIEQTFLVTVILLSISIIPAYFISKYIIGQIQG